MRLKSAIILKIKYRISLFNMKTIKQQSEEYALKYPSEIRNEIAKAWIDGRNSIRKKEVIDLYFVEEEYKDIFIYWLNYKKERGQPYKQTGAEACYRKLLTLSGGDKQMMIAIIEQSMSNNYQGLFPLKDNGNRNHTNKQGNSGSIFQAADCYLQEHQ